MELKQLLFGCTLALAGVGSAMATDIDTQNIATSHAATEGGSHDGGNADAVGPEAGNANHECTAACTTGDSPDGSEASGAGTAPSPHPHASHHSSLGWQSLLPGSIQ